MQDGKINRQIESEAHNVASPSSDIIRCAAGNAN